MGYGKPQLRIKDNKLIVETPFNNTWIQAIKASIPVDSRQWDTRAGLWLVDPRYYNAVRTITVHFFGEGVLDSTGGGVGCPQDLKWETKWQLFQANGNTRPFIKPTVNGKGPRDLFFVTEDAPDWVITAVYRVMAKKYHPDNGGDAETMKQINEAYNKLVKSNKHANQTVA